MIILLSFKPVFVLIMHDITSLCMRVYTAGEGLEFPGESFIREEGTEADASGEGRPDAAGDQGLSEEEERSLSTDQQTLKSEVCLIREPLCSTAGRAVVNFGCWPHPL